MRPPGFRRGACFYTFTRQVVLEQVVLDNLDKIVRGFAGDRTNSLYSLYRNAYTKLRGYRLS